MSRRIPPKVKAAPGPPSAPSQNRLANRPKSSAEPPVVQDVLQSPGQQLDAGTRAFMDSRFGHDFSKVRVHADAQAADSARMVNALAYTVGHDIVFGAGQYAPSTTAGKRLLAHELTHVVQQAGPLTLQRQVDKEAPPDLPPDKALPSTLPPEKAAPPPEEEAEEPQEAEGSELSPEPIEPLPEGIYESEDVAPEEEGAEEEGATQEGSKEASIATAPAGPAPSLLTGQIVPPDHASEQEAEAVSQAIISGPEKGGPPRISSIMPPGKKPVQRQIFWEDRSALAWTDFKAKPPKNPPFDAVTFSGFKAPNLKTQTEVNPDHPIFPTQCKIGNKNTTMFRGVVSLDISKAALNVRAVMQPSKSWVVPGKASPTLLAHEQGHFDISNVIAEKTEFALLFWGIQNVGSATKCGKTAANNAAVKAWNALKPNKALQAIGQKGIDVLKKAQKDYDTQTGHGVKAADQKTWQGNISADLPGYDVL